MQFKWKPPAWAIVVLAVLGVFVASVGISLVDDNGDGRPDRVDIIVTPANVQAGDGLPTSTVVADAALVEKIAAANVESDLRTLPDEIPAKRAETIREGIKRAADENRATTDALPTAGAVRGFAGCTTKILPNNWSSRNGVLPVWQDDHYTVSFNRAGWGDVLAIWTYFAQPSTKASSNFILDTEGHCLYAVPIEGKSWTQGGANPFAISYEVIAYGNERDYLEPAGWARLKSIKRQVRDRTGIPLRRGTVNPANRCTPGRSGIVQHADHGLCGGGHHDIRPFSIDRVVKIVSEPTTRLTKYERRIARERCDARAKVTAAPKASAARRELVVASRVDRRVVRSQMRHLTLAKQRSGKPWRFRHRGARRHELARVWSGTSCTG